MVNNEDILALLSRIEERVKGLTGAVDRLQDLPARVQVLESRNGHKLDEIEETLHNLDNRVALLEQADKGNVRKWERLLDVLFRLGVGVALAVILWKIGLKP